MTGPQENVDRPTLHCILRFPLPICKSQRKPGHSWERMQGYLFGAARTLLLWVSVRGLCGKEEGISILILTPHFKKSTPVLCVWVFGSWICPVFPIFPCRKDYWDWQPWSTASCICTVSSGHIARSIISFQKYVHLDYSWYMLSGKFLGHEAFLSIN